MLWAHSRNIQLDWSHVMRDRSCLYGTGTLRTHSFVIEQVFVRHVCLVLWHSWKWNYLKSTGSSQMFVANDYISLILFFFATAWSAWQNGCGRLAAIQVVECSKNLMRFIMYILFSSNWLK